MEILLQISVSEFRHDVRWRRSYWKLSACWKENKCSNNLSKKELKKGAEKNYFLFLKKPAIADWYDYDTKCSFNVRSKVD